ncbi:exported protein of unknown function [Streptomyces sp. KY75]|nr:exported protein of unknown function [Streptomyces sp. KY75]CAD5991840.1 exported protein of unknown function [Streptomyces sp. KY70]
MATAVATAVVMSCLRFRGIGTAPALSRGPPELPAGSVGVVATRGAARGAGAGRGARAWCGGSGAEAARPGERRGGRSGAC